MEALLTGAATFLLESVASLGIDKGIQKLEESLSDKSLLKVDSKIREYLMEHLSDYDYEKIDSFLSNESIYAHEQGSVNTLIMTEQTNTIIEKFFTTHPSLQHARQTLTSLLRQAITSAYQSVLSQLSKEAKILYSQAAHHRSQSHIEHQKLSGDIQDIKQQLLVLQPTKKLSYSEVIKIFYTLSEAIHLGNFSTSGSLIQLLENQIDVRDQSYCTALKIYLHCFIGLKKDVDILCEQYLREDPSNDLTTTIATFLLQMGCTSALKIIQSSISDSQLAVLVGDYTANTFQNATKSIVDADGKLKKECETVEAALWVFANYSKKSGDYTSALMAYSKIEQLHHTNWVQWELEVCKAMLIFTDSIVDSNFDIAIMRHQVEKLLTFSDMFQQLADDLCVEYIDTLLTCAKVLPIVEFDSYYNRLTSHMKEMPLAKKHNYSAHLINLESIDEKELRTFCRETGNDNLWAAYLFHRSADNPEFVLKQIEENNELLSKEFTFILAYHESLSALRGEAVAFDTISALTIPQTLLFPYNVYMTEVSQKLSNGKTDLYLQAAIDEVLKPSGTISVFYLRVLINLLVNADRWLEASQILEQYQDRAPSFVLLRLNILMAHEDQFETCTVLIEKLEKCYPKNAFLLYCKGFIAEQQLLGSGAELFSNAFHYTPCTRYAYSTLISRLNRKLYIEDDILSYAATSNDIILLYASGRTYEMLGKKEQSNLLLKQALINSSETYDEGIYAAFMNLNIGENTPSDVPEAVGGDTCFSLVKDGISPKKIWIHDDNINIPSEGSKFADYEHIASNNPVALLLLGYKEGETVSIYEEEYVVTGINHGNIIALQYCMKKLLEHGVMTQFSVQGDNIMDTLEEMRKYDEAHHNHVQNVIKDYKEFAPGITLDLLASEIGKPYYKAVNLIFLDNNLPLWASINESVSSDNFILTPSSLAILASLNVSPKRHEDNSPTLYVTSALKTELDHQIRKHTNDKTAAVLGFDDDGHPFMFENTDADKQYINSYLAYIRMWVEQSHVLDPISPEHYPSDIKKVADVVGIPNIESFLYAQNLSYSVCCDDINIRKIMKYRGVGTISVVDLLINLNYPFEKIIGSVKSLIDHKYQTPITTYFFKWLSNMFYSQEDEDHLLTISLATIDLVEKIVSDDDARSFLFYLYRESTEEMEALHQTLDWIIKKTIAKYLYSQHTD